MIEPGYIIAGLSALGGAVWALVTMHFSVQVLILSVGEMKDAVKEANLGGIVLAKQMALLEFRISAIEEEQKRMKQLERVPS
jgi:hypothetical protein